LVPGPEVETVPEEREEETEGLSLVLGARTVEVRR
jgi:hypothetical protein